MASSKRRAPTAARVDGRRLRSLRTKQRIIDAYLALAGEMSPLIPTAAQIAQRSGYSTRSVFERFPDIESLQVAAVDHVLSQLPPECPHENGERIVRIRAQVEKWGRDWDRWLPLWRSLVANHGPSRELSQRLIALRERDAGRLAAMYAPELSTVSTDERRRLLIALEALTDAESWARMQELFGLSFKEACAVWIQAIDRLLPRTPSNA